MRPLQRRRRSRLRGPGFPTDVTHGERRPARAADAVVPVAWPRPRSRGSARTSRPAWHTVGVLARPHLSITGPRRSRMTKPDPMLLIDVVAPRVLEALKLASAALLAANVRHVVVGGLAVGANVIRARLRSSISSS